MWEKIRRYRLFLALTALAVFLLIFNIIAAPSAKKEKKVGAQSLKDLAEIATTEYTIKKIVRYKDVNLLGSRAILIETTAILKAGIDLSEMNSQDIRQAGDAITIILPVPKLISLNMRPGDMKEVYNETGVLRDAFSADEKEKFLAQGQKDIMDKLEEIGILKKAGVYARSLLESWLKMLGFKEITIIFKEQARPEQARPEPAPVVKTNDDKTN
jgi:hypothetical protein